MDADSVRKIHAGIVDSEGALAGERCNCSLEAAMSRIDWRNSFDETGDHFDTAGTYTFALVCGHTFLDGNKRTGLATALAYLEIHGVKIPRAEHFEEAMLAVADGYFIEEDISAMYRGCAPECRADSKSDARLEDSPDFSKFALEDPLSAKILWEGWCCLSEIGKIRLIEFAARMLDASNRERIKKGEAVKLVPPLSEK